jgi:hypothetical protein
MHNTFANMIVRLCFLSVGPRFFCNPAERKPQGRVSMHDPKSRSDSESDSDLLAT